MNCFRAAVALAVAAIGAACAYDEAQSWRECCGMEIADREESGSKEGRSLFAWARVGGLSGDGKSMGWGDAKASRKRKVAVGLADFQMAHPVALPRDYLADLGMTCASSAKAELSRCAVELPVWVRCTVKFGWPFLSTPVPKELQKPIAAILQMTIDVSASDILDSSVQVVPLPGGRLCHR